MRTITKAKEWDNIRRKLKVEFEEKEITRCELGLPGCKRDNFLSFAHRHKRVWYDEHKGMLGKFEQCLLLCTFPCHDTLEKDAKLTEETFLRLRGEEIL